MLCLIFCVIPNVFSFSHCLAYEGAVLVQYIVVSSVERFFIALLYVDRYNRFIIFNEIKKNIKCIFFIFMHKKYPFFLCVLQLTNE